MPRDSPKLVFTHIGGFPGCGSKDLSNPKDAKSQNDAMVNVYPLDCLKPDMFTKKWGIQKINQLRPKIHISGPVLFHFP